MPELKIGVVGIPGKWSTEVLADNIEERTGFRLVIDMAEVVLDLSTGRLLYRGVDLCTLDGLMIKKISAIYSPNTLDRLELLRVAEAAGVRLFSGAEQILRLVDRLSCTVTLANAGIPMPATVATEDIEQALAFTEQFGEVVLKPLFSTKARGMTVVGGDQSTDEIRESLQQFKQQHPMIYLQQKLNLPGHDMGLVFLGGEYQGAYARVSGDDSWNTTIHSGGKYAAIEPSSETIAMAKRAQAPFGLDFTTVDVAGSEQGDIVFEVSAFGGFRGALEGAGFDAAAAYADYALKKLTER